MLGLEVTGRSAPGPVPGDAIDLPGEVEWEAARVATGPDAPYGVQLVEWRQPRPVGKAVSRANQLGLYRTAFLVEDARASVTELRRLGVDCPDAVWLDMGPEIPVDGLWAAFFTDPDGMCLELIQTPEL